MPLLDVGVVLMFACLGIRQLQLILLKVSLIVGVEVHVNVEFLKLREPLGEQDNDGELINTTWKY